MDEPTVIGIIYSDIQEIKKDINTIKEWRWRMAGMGIVISLIGTIAFQIIIAIVQKQS